jgi:hypothetical protein
MKLADKERASQRPLDIRTAVSSLNRYEHIVCPPIILTNGLAFSYSNTMQNN